MTVQENRHRRNEAGKFAVGDKAYISAASLRFPYALSGKFIPKYVGPFEITAIGLATSTYTFNLPSYLNIHKRLHVSKLRPWYPNDDSRFPSRAFANPPPLIGATDDPEAEWEVEKIVGDKTVRGRLKYKVRWLGWAARWDDWIDAEELKTGAAAIVDAYESSKSARRAPAPQGARKRGTRSRVVALLSSLTIRSVLRGVGARPGSASSASSLVKVTR